MSKAIGIGCKTLRLIAVVVLTLFAAEAKAVNNCDSVPEQSSSEQSRPVASFYQIEIGNRHALSTYLSPVRYHGPELNLSGNWEKGLPFNPRHAIMGFEGSVGASSLLNPAQTASMLGIEGTFAFSMSWRRPLPYGLQLTVGGYYGIEGEALWLSRNSNNPVALDLWTGIGLGASLSYKLKIGRLPVLISDKVRTPLIGCFFMPGYGQSYYEIYLGNHKDLAHAGWLGNRFAVDNLLSATLDFGRTSMLVGFRYRFSNAEANNLIARGTRLSFVIGVVPGGIGLKKKRPGAVSPLYY